MKIQGTITVNVMETLGLDLDLECSYRAWAYPARMTAPAEADVEFDEIKLGDRVLTVSDEVTEILAAKVWEEVADRQMEDSDHE